MKVKDFIDLDFTLPNEYRVKISDKKEIVTLVYDDYRDDEKRKNFLSQYGDLDINLFQYDRLYAGTICTIYATYMGVCNERTL